MSISADVSHNVLQVRSTAPNNHQASASETNQTQEEAEDIDFWMKNGLTRLWNAVDEVQALDLLKKASDYERGYDRLSDKLKAAVQRLREFAGDVKIFQRKRKHMCCSQKV